MLKFFLPHKLALVVLLLDVCMCIIVTASVISHINNTDDSESSEPMILYIKSIQAVLILCCHDS